MSRGTWLAQSEEYVTLDLRVTVQTPQWVQRLLKEIIVINLKEKKECQKKEKECQHYFLILLKTVTQKCQELLTTW